MKKLHRQPITRLIPASVALAAFAGAASAQWVEFNDGTDNRLDAPANLVENDNQEKDYAWGDFDNDGDVDLVVARKQPFTTPGKRVNVLLMNEDGVLTDRTTEYATATDVPGDEGFNTATNDRDILVMDVDQDGWLDVVTGPTYSNESKAISHPRVYYNLKNNGQGEWQGFEFQNDRIPELSPIEGPNICHLDSGDVNGDGSPDLWLIDYDGTSVDLNNRLLINDGNGFFTDESQQRLTSGMMSSGFGASGYVTDLNSDGVRDLIKQSAGSSAVIYNNPFNEGIFDFQLSLTGGATYFVQIGDLNNDGLMDVVASDDGQDEYLINTGNGGNNAAQFDVNSFDYQGGGFDDGFAGNSLVRDLNNDGWNDVLITDVDVDISGCGRRMHIYRNLADGPDVTLVEEQSGGQVAGIPTSSLTGTHDVAVFDINGDGWNDLVVGRCTGTQVYINNPPISASFNFEGEQPQFATPGNETTFQVSIVADGDDIDTDNTTLTYSVNGGSETTVPMNYIPGVESGTFEGTLPAGECGDNISYFIAAELMGGSTFTFPEQGEFELPVADGIETTVSSFEDGEDDFSVTSDDDVTGGAWERAEPNGTTDGGDQAAPDSASDGDFAFVTGNGEPGEGPNENDVDGAFTTLFTPVIDLSAGDASVSFDYWYYNSDAGSDPFQNDSIDVSISNDAGESWTSVVRVDANSEGWENFSFNVSEFVEPNGSVQIRFRTGDPGNNSTCEAGIDNFVVSRPVCDTPSECDGDYNDDNIVNSDDLNVVLGGFGVDFDSDDLNEVLGNFGEDCN